MKIALIVIVYVILGCLSTLGAMICEYKLDYSEYTPEAYYKNEIEDEEWIYVMICVFWPLAIVGMFLYFGCKYLIRSLVYVLNYIFNISSDE